MDIRVNCGNAKVVGQTTKPIRNQATYVTAHVAARDVEGSETSARAKAVMAPRVPGPYLAVLSEGEEIVPASGENRSERIKSLSTRHARSRTPAASRSKKIAEDLSSAVVWDSVGPKESWMPYTKRFEDTLYSKDWLDQKYTVERLSTAEIAEHLRCDPSAVWTRLKVFGIPVRDNSEAQKLVPHPGSHAPRPRGQFLSTLHDREWMLDRVERGLSASQIAREAGCSTPVVKGALESLGLYDRWRETRYRPSEGQERIVPFRERTKRRDTEGAIRARGRRACPGAPCSVCGHLGRTDVNHRDGNYRNNEAGNLQRLCRLCHRKQHAMETKVAFRLLEERGIFRAEIAAMARAELLKIKVN